MSSFQRIALIMFILVGVASGIAFSGCSHLKNKNPETLSQQDRDSVATIERQEASGDSSSTETAMEKDSIRRDHILKF